MAVAIIVLLFSVKNGMDKTEVVECQQWVAQAWAYPEFFLAKWQDEQCRAHGIIINSVVK